MLFLRYSQASKHASYWFDGCIRDFYMEVHVCHSWDGWSEQNLQFDAFIRSNLPLSNLGEMYAEWLVKFRNEHCH